MPAKLKLHHHWTASGLASAIGGFFPIPFIESAIDNRAKRYAIQQTFKHHDIDLDDEVLRSLAGSTDKNLSRLIHYAVAVPLKLLLFPFKKLVILIWSTRELPSDFAHTYLLAKTVDWCLKNDYFENKNSSLELKLQSQKIRDSFDKAFNEIDSKTFEFIRSSVRKELAAIKPSMIKLVLKITGRSVNQAEESRLEDRAKEIQKLMLENGEKMQSDQSTSSMNTETLFQKFITNFQAHYRAN